MTGFLPCGRGVETPDAPPPHLPAAWTSGLSSRKGAPGAGLPRPRGSAPGTERKGPPVKTGKNRKESKGVLERTAGNAAGRPPARTFRETRKACGPRGGVGRESRRMVPLPPPPPETEWQPWH